MGAAAGAGGYTKCPLMKVTLSAMGGAGAGAETGQAS